MYSLIQFRAQLNSLTENEFVSFLGQLYQSFNERDIITKALFYLFHAHRNQHHNKEFTVTKSIISNIIKSRKKKQVDPSESNEFIAQETPIQFDKLPSAVINECSSYMDFYTFQSFQIVNRDVYLSCNECIPLKYVSHQIFNKIYSNVRHLVNDQHLQLSKYKKLEHLGINLMHFKKMNVLHKIKLSSKIKSLHLYHGVPDTIFNLFNSRCIDCDGIKKIMLDDYHFDHPIVTETYVQSLFDIMCKFKNMECLELRAFDITDDIVLEFYELMLNRTETKNFLPNIKAFIFYGGSRTRMQFYNTLLSTTSQKLISLHIDGIVQSKAGFSNLQELCIWKPDKLKIWNVTQTARHLKKIHLDFIRYSMDEEFIWALKDLLGQSSLNYISIKVDQGADIIINVLRDIHFDNRETLTIKFVIDGRFESRCHEYYEFLVERIQKTSTEFMLIFICFFTKEMERYGIDCEDGILTVGKKVRFVRRNMNNKTGYIEKWMYPCLLNDH